MRRAVFIVPALLAAFAFATPASAASATSWRATIVGAQLHGGATTVIAGNGTGSISVKLYDVTPGQVPIALVNPTACPTEAQDLFSFDLSAANAAGISTGRHALTSAQVTAYNAALSMQIKLSILVVTLDDKGCGDQLGAPSVGTARLTGTVAAVGATYDLRYPVIGGIDPIVAASINGFLAQDAQSTVTGFTQEAMDAGLPFNGNAPTLATQTFSVSLSQPALLSLGELYFQFNTGAAHPIAALSTDTFDLLTGHRLTLADIFRPGSGYLSVLSTESRARLRALLDDASLDSWIDMGTTPSAANFASWQLVPTGLRITFGEYQVGPYAIGMRAIVIPWASLRPVLDLGSPIAGLVPAGPCLATQLSAQMSDWDAGLGSRFNTVHVTNDSAVACVLQGTPQSQLIDGTGRVLLSSGAATVHPSDPRVVIAAGATGHIDLRTGNYCGAAATNPIRIVLRLPSGGGRLVASPSAGGSTTTDLPPCNGPVPGLISTNGWHHG
jgi:hypothetical protein